MRFARLAAVVASTALGCARPDAPVAAPALVVDVAPSTTAIAASVSAPAAPTRPAMPVWGPTVVRVGNQRPLGGSAVEFARYLNAMHNRIHPLFTDASLSRLDQLPPSHPMNDMKLDTRLEIEIEPVTGNVVKQSVVRTSGVREFDALAMSAVAQAAPFGPASGQLLSTDGNVYVHWEFKRDPVFGCSTMQARPFLLDLWPAPAPAPL